MLPEELEVLHISHHSNQVDIFTQRENFWARVDKHVGLLMQPNPIYPLGSQLSTVPKNILIQRSSNISVATPQSHSSIP